MYNRIRASGLMLHFVQSVFIIYVSFEVLLLTKMKTEIICDLQRWWKRKKKAEFVLIGYELCVKSF